MLRDVCTETQIQVKMVGILCSCTVFRLQWNVECWRYWNQSRVSTPKCIMQAWHSQFSKQFSLVTGCSFLSRTITPAKLFTFKNALARVSRKNRANNGKSVIWSLIKIKRHFVPAQISRWRHNKIDDSSYHLGGRGSEMSAFFLLFKCVCVLSSLCHRNDTTKCGI